MPGPLLLMWVVIIGPLTIPPQFIFPGLVTKHDRRVFNLAVFAYWLTTYAVAVVISYFTIAAPLGLWAFITVGCFILLNAVAVRTRIGAIRRRKAAQHAAAAPLWNEDDLAFIRHLQGDN